MIAKRTCEIIRPRSFSAQPETTWREAVSDKTAALDARMKGTDERLASVQKAMEVNKEAIDKAVGAAEKAVGGIKADVEKAVGGFKTEVVGIKADMEKAVGGIKTDMKDALKLEISAMEKVLKSEVSSVKDSFKSIERIFILAVAVFIFGKPVLGGIKDVFDAAKEGVSSKKE
jgi:hypothetical protein